MKRTYAIYTAICCVAIIAIHALPHSLDPGTTMTDASFRSAFNQQFYMLFSKAYPLAKEIPFLVLLLIPAIAVIAAILKRSPLIPGVLTGLTHLFFAYEIYIGEYVVMQPELLGPATKLTVVLAAAILLGPALLLIKPKPRERRPAGADDQGRKGPALPKPRYYIECPKCRVSVVRMPRCSRCGYDMKSYFVSKKLKPRNLIQCPECSSIVPMSAKCSRCGFEMKTYYTTGQARKGGAPVKHGKRMSLGAVFSRAMAVFRHIGKR